MKKGLILFLSLCLLLTGCRRGEGRTAFAPDNVTDAPPQALKTGLATATTVSKSQNATLDFPGFSRTDITLAAVLLDHSGIIRQCILDGVTAVIPFDHHGFLQSPEKLCFPTKNELGQDYGMHKASSLGREWDEQASAFAAYAVGRRPEELQPGDVSASVTVDTDGFLQAIRSAAADAEDTGAREGDHLALVCDARMDKSRSADPHTGEDGIASCYAACGAVTFRGNLITGCRFESVETALPVTCRGDVAAEASLPLSGAQTSGDPFSVRSKSAAGERWGRQADAFASRLGGLSAYEIQHLTPDEIRCPCGTVFPEDTLAQLVNRAWQQVSG